MRGTNVGSASACTGRSCQPQMAGLLIADSVSLAPIFFRCRRATFSSRCWAAHASMACGFATGSIWRPG